MKNVPTRVALERVQQTCGEEYRPYLAPIDTLEMLIAKPMRHIRWPAVMNGERILIRSDQFAKMMIRMAFVETLEDAFFSRLLRQRTGKNVGRDRQQLRRRGVEPESVDNGPVRRRLARVDMAKHSKTHGKKRVIPNTLNKFSTWIPAERDRKTYLV
jgi:hypothetical protein